MPRRNDRSRSHPRDIASPTPVVRAPVVGALLVAATAMGCGGSEEVIPSKAPAAPESDAPSRATVVVDIPNVEPTDVPIAPPPRATPPRPPVATAESTTICDRYMKTLEACMPKLPEASRDAMRQGLDAFKSSFDVARGNAEAVKAMETACQAGVEALRPLCGGDAP